MSNEIITLKNLRLSYGKKTVLNNLNIGFEKGKTVLIAGNNGAGKSTLLKCIAGIIYPDSGEIVIDKSIPRNKVGFISDKMSLFRDLTLQQGIDFHMDLFNVKKGDFDDSLLRKLKFDMSQKIKSLSNGERAVYHLSLLLSQKPAILLIDEIIHTIDPYLRELFLESLIDMIDQIKTTVIMINHTFSEMGRLPERVLIMEEGGFIFDETNELLNQKIKKIESEEELNLQIPVIFQRNTELCNEYYIYPFEEKMASESPYEFLDVDLSGIVKSFIGGYYAKKRI